MTPATRRKSKPSGPPPMGAHMSVAGGVDRAIDRAREAGCTALQIFLKNNNQWHGKPLEPSAIERWKLEIAKGDLAPAVAHANYLINLGGPNPELLEKSRASMLDELARAEVLGVPGIVLHPGAHMGRGEAEAIAQIAAEINRLFAETPGNPAAIYLETTAGQGSSIGHRFEHLRDIIALIEDRSRVAVCMDTCHVFAAGYDIRTAAGVKAMLKEFDEKVGLGLLKVMHTNDSKKELGTRVDRHTHIGQGFIGPAGFAALLRDPRLANVPFILETPKEDDLAEDKMNLGTLRALWAEGPPEE